MAITKLAAPGSVPASIADWSAVVAQLSALVMDKEAPFRISGSSVLKGSLFNIGGVLYVADDDTAISGTASDIVQLSPSGATVTAAFVADLTGVSWNAAYKGYYDDAGNLYVFDEPSYRHGRSAFFKSGIWVCPLGVSQVLLTGIGGGGNGGAGGAAYSQAGTGGGGGGGGSGAYADRIPVTVVPGTVYAVTVGIGVATTLGELFSLAPGGAGGPGGAGTSSSGGNAGAGGAAGAGNGISLSGTQGSAGSKGGSNSGNQAGGSGGPSGNCGLYNAHAGADSGGGGYANAGGAGADAQSYGGGGGGGGGGGHSSSMAYAGGDGGKGKAGFLLIEW
jgi:hypothetical protein